MDRSSSGASRRAVLFVCSSNFSRSPLAAAIFNRIAADSGLDGRFHAESAGAYPGFEPRGAERKTQELARAKDLDLAGHTVREVSEDDFRKFDHLISLDEDSGWYLRELCPDRTAKEKIERLTSFLGDLSLKEFADPVSGSMEYEELYELLERSIRGLIERLSKNA